MGKRVGVTNVQQDAAAARSIRKRKRAAPIVVATIKSKCPRVHASENDDEDSSSSSNDAMDAMHTDEIMQRTESAVVRKHNNIATAGGGIEACATPHNNNSSMLLNASFGSIAEHNNFTGATTESPKPVYTLRPSVVNGTILRDLKSKSWRLGRPIGKGNFGEIFLASDDVTVPATNENAKFVVKIEPHSNGPLFVEIHCLMNTAKNNNNKNEANIDDDETEENKIKTEPDTKQLSDIPPTGIPDYLATGSHYFNNERYRFLVLPRFDQDLHSLIKNSCVQQKCLLTLAVNIVNALESLHDRGYCHNDIKAQNLMLSKCKYLKKQTSAADFVVKKTSQGKYAQNVQKFNDEHYEEKQQTTDSGNSSEQEANDEDFYPPNEKFELKRQLYDEEEDEDFDDGATTNSNHSNSMDMFQTPVNKKRLQSRRNNVIEFSGSNPVRSCRREKRHSMYEEMVKSHYLRPAKRISYSELFNEDGVPVKEESNSGQSGSSDNESEEFIPPRSLGFTSPNKKLSSSRRSGAAKHSRRNNKETQCTNSVTRSLRATRNNGAVNNNTAAGAVASNAAHAPHHVLHPVEEERIFLIDFGLASKFEDRGVHRPFIMDQRRAHDGTLEFTSRDAHLGAHSRRSDLECLGYNLLYWSQGYLPWKDAAQQQLQEKVHRSKELLMTNVREMLKQIYGKKVPKFLGEFLHHVGQLNYQERPDYERYRNIFKREYQLLGYAYNEMQLNSKEIQRTCIRVKDEVDGNAAAGVGIVSDIFELNNSVIRNSMLSTPLNEHSLTTRVSPKNLRSKSDKKTNKKKKFSWAEVLSQDPDQIARERAAKEFEREEDIYPEELQKSRQYEGKPTYAILQVQQMLRSKGRSVPEHNTDTDEDMNGIGEQEDDTEDDANSNYDEELEAASSDNEDEDEYETEIGEEEEEEQEEQDEEETEKEDQNLYATVYSKRSTTKQPKSKKVGRSTKKASAEASVQPLQPRRGTTKVKFSTTTRSAAQKRNPVAAAGASVVGKRAAQSRAAASAAGEVEHHKPETINSSKQQSRTRRARRCLQPETENTVNDEESSSSNYGPDMQGLCQIWTKFDNESVYLRGRNAAAASAAATVASANASKATLNTVSKHSRK